MKILKALLIITPLMVALPVCASMAVENNHNNIVTKKVEYIDNNRVVKRVEYYGNDGHKNRFKKDAQKVIKRTVVPQTGYGKHGKFFLRKVHVKGNDLIYDYLDHNLVSDYNPVEWTEYMKGILNSNFCKKPYARKADYGIIYRFTIQPRGNKFKQVIKTLRVSTKRDCYK